MVACVYRPPGTVTSTFTDQRSDLFDQLELMGLPLAALDDFNVPGVTARQLDRRATDVFHQHGLQQHVTSHYANTWRSSQWKHTRLDPDI